MRDKKLRCFSSVFLVAYFLIYMVYWSASQYPIYTETGHTDIVGTILPLILGRAMCLVGIIIIAIGQIINKKVLATVGSICMLGFSVLGLIMDIVHLKNWTYMREAYEISMMFTAIGITVWVLFLIAVIKPRYAGIIGIVIIAVECIVFLGSMYVDIFMYGSTSIGGDIQYTVNTILLTLGLYVACKSFKVQYDTQQYRQYQVNKVSFIVPENSSVDCITVICPHCGMKVKKTTYCPMCGTRLTNGDEGKQDE